MTTNPLPLDAAALATAFCFHDLFGDDAGKEKAPYIFAETLGVRARSETQAAIKIHANSFFVAHMTMAVGHLADQCLVSFRVDSTDRPLMNAPVPVSMLGTAAAPLLLPTPLRLSPSSHIVVRIGNDGDRDATVTIAFVGYKVYLVPFGRSEEPGSPPTFEHKGLARLKAFLDQMATEL